MDRELHEKFSTLRWLLRREHKRLNEDPACDCSEGQGRVLAALRAKGEMKTRDLSLLLGIRTQSLNELLSKLESGGYILRKPASCDKRVVVVSLTKKGHCAKQSQGAALDIFSSLGEEEKHTLSKLFDKNILDVKKKTGTETIL